VLRLAVSFTNFGPYHLARLRALGTRLRGQGGELIAVETAGVERKYPWESEQGDEPFRRVTLFPDRPLERVAATECASAMRRLLRRERPDAVAVAGYVRPEALAALGWAERSRRPSVLMSESQAIDRPRVWWKESVKRRRVRRFGAALVGGESHRAYLVELGMPADRIALGYNAVDQARFARLASDARRVGRAQLGLPEAPYILAVARFVPEKNLPALVRAYARARRDAGALDLVLCGAGPEDEAIRGTIVESGVAGSVHRPGFLRADELSRWYAHALAFVLPSLSEPWGLVANEAAACGVPLIVSERAGCAGTLVPEPAGCTGLRFDPEDESALAAALGWVAALPEDDRAAMGRRAAEVASAWGPERFATGLIEALGHAAEARRARHKPVSRTAEAVKA
jgi:1,2-diacylglycerol 3-alpha-glucosyltransferase